MSTSTLRLSSIPYVLWAYKSILLEECFRCSTKPSDYFPKNHFTISSSFTTQAAPSVHRIECHCLCLESKAPMLSQHLHRGPSSPSNPTPHPPRHIRSFPSQPSSHLFTSERLSSFSIWPKPHYSFKFYSWEDLLWLVVFVKWWLRACTESDFLGSILPPLLTGSVTMNKLFYFTCAQFPHLRQGD